MVGVLFCFINGEVRTEIIKKWKRWRTIKNMHLPSTTNSQFKDTVQRTSIGSELYSLTPKGPQSRQASINSIKSSMSSGSSPIHQAIEETNNLLSIDDNQNELEIKEPAATEEEDIL